MHRVRSPAVAGMFYPSDPAQLKRDVAAMLAQADARVTPPKALIVPHAGYVYSGPVAARAYATLADARDRIRKVVLLGPSHRVYFKGLAAPLADEFATPLGTIAVDQRRIDQLAGRYPFVQRLPDAHVQEHSLEVHLPFLQAQLDDFELIPLVVGDATPEQVAQVLNDLWGDDSTLIVISTDLSHYHDYATAKKLDGETASLIEHLQPEALSGERACGFLPVSGLLLAARQRGIRPERLDLRNSGDTAGPRDQVVGYGAWALHDRSAGHDTEDLSETERSLLKDLARESIRHGLENGRPPSCQAGEDTPPGLLQPGASFVTLKKDGRLRGCIGSLEAYRPLAEDVCENAFAAAFRDPRFPPLAPDEFPELDISISVLTPAEPMAFDSEQDLIARLQPGIDGLILTDAGRRGTFLPSVWDEIPQATEFLRALKRKAGLPADYWSDTIRVDRYRTISW